MLPLPPTDMVPLQGAPSDAAPGMAAAPGRGGAAPQPMFLDRDHSILAFNERVFDWALRSDIPLLERLRYLCIVSANLDEFFEGRAAPHITAAQQGQTQGLYTTRSFEALSAKVQHLVARQYSLYNEVLLPAFPRHGIRIVTQADRSPAQKRWVHESFIREVRPLLIPVGLDPAHPFPQVANKSLTFIIRLKAQAAFGRKNEISIVKVPRALPRLLRMPAKVAPGEALFASLSSIIRAHLEELFPGREVTEFSQFRVTRHSDLALDEEDVRNLRTALRQGLQHRHYGQAVRLEVSAACSPFLSDFLLAQFGLPAAALYRVHGPVNLARLAQLVDLVNRPALLFPAWDGAWPRQLRPGRSIMAQLRRRDVLIHQPFESFDGLLAFLREAVNDPQVLAIKQTIYRTGSDSALMALLTEAVRRGKEVMAVVELKARFDEEVNINWAEALESIGAQVVYGVVGLKTHAKMLLVTRREGRQLRRYGHLATGNYNMRTARLYTDLSYLSPHHTLPPHIHPPFNHTPPPPPPTPPRSGAAAPPAHPPRRHGRRIQPPGQPEPAAPFAPADAGAVSPAAPHAGKDRAGRTCRQPWRGRPHRRQDERADRRGADAGRGPGGSAGRAHRSDRGRRLHVGGATARGHGQHPRALGDWPIPGAHAGFLLLRRQRGRPVSVQRRLDEPQHAAPCRAGLAGDRPGLAPADHRRMPGGLSAR